MRKITQDAIRAFRNNRKFKRGNTEVRVFSNEDGYNSNNLRQLRLHNNVIAVLSNDGLVISDGGWQSRTTKERLNGLPNVFIHQKDWQWYLNGEPWSGYPIKV